MPNYYVGDMLCDSDFLAHHGIKGQKWGIRRYQNPDGTLTAAGIQRYRSQAEKEYAERKDVKGRYGATYWNYLNRGIKKSSRKEAAYLKKADENMSNEKKVQRLLKKAEVQRLNKELLKEMEKKYMDLPANAQRMDDSVMRTIYGFEIMALPFSLIAPPFGGPEAGIGTMLGAKLINNTRGPGSEASKILFDKDYKNLDPEEQKLRRKVASMHV